MQAKDPPEIDERQAEMLRLRGFKWDPKSGRWFRGDPSTRDRRAAECRSGSRVARFVDANGEPVAVGRAVRKGIRQLESVLQDARDRALDTTEGTRAIDLQIKDKLAAPWAPLAWGAAQLAVGAVLCSAMGTSDSNVLQWSATAQTVTAEASPPSSLVGSALLGVALGVPVAISRRRLTAVHAGAGVEGSSGQLERALADSALGSHALPAPWEWRCGDGSARWRALALSFELVASSNVLVALHGVLQPAIRSSVAASLPAPLASPLAPAVALGATALLPAAAERYFFGDPVLDGLPAELQAAARFGKTSDAYFAMTARAAADPADAAASAAAARSLASAWEARFGGGSAAERATESAAAVAAAATMTGLAWQLGGDSLVAALVAGVVGTADAYLVSADTEAARVGVELPAECEGR